MNFIYTETNSCILSSINLRPFIKQLNIAAWVKRTTLRMLQLHTDFKKNMFNALYVIFLKILCINILVNCLSKASVDNFLVYLCQKLRYFSRSMLEFCKVFRKPIYVKLSISINTHWTLLVFISIQLYIVAEILRMQGMRSRPVKLTASWEHKVLGCV